MYQFNEQYGSYVTELVISGRIVRRATYIFEDKCRYVNVYNTCVLYFYHAMCKFILRSLALENLKVTHNI